MSAEIIQLGSVAKQRRKGQADQREEAAPDGCMTAAEFAAAYEAASPQEKMRVLATMGLLPAAAALGRETTPDPFFALVARIQAARSDLGWGAAVTVAHDIEKARTTFEQVAAGKPLTQEMLEPVFALHDAWKAAEAVFQEAIRDIARRTGRSPKSIAATVHHVRKGHRVNSAT